MLTLAFILVIVLQMFGADSEFELWMFAEPETQI